MSFDTNNNITGTRPELPDLFTWTDDGVRLRSAQCKDCGTFFFPEYHEQHRPGCPRENIEKVLLSGRGKLVSYTVMHYMCPPPFRTANDITPYAIGMVEFPEGISVVGLIMESDISSLKVGYDMETITYELYRREEGFGIVTWAFRVH